MGVLRRWLDRLAEPDELRLATEVREWAEGIPGSTRIDELPMRQRAKVAGVIRRLTVLPIHGDESLEAVVTDGTGEIVVRFTGRRRIGGLGLGTRVVVEGVVGEQRGSTTMMNPRLEFSG
jgi:RecG-like helicase